MKDFLKIRADLEQTLKETLHGFFNDRGLVFDKEAWEHQSGTDLQDLTRSLLMLGADVFPKDRLEPDDSQIQLQES